MFCGTKKICATNVPVAINGKQDEALAYEISLLITNSSLLF
jgi:hypothetical protein